MRPKARYRCAPTEPVGWDGPSSRALRTSSSRHDYNCVSGDLLARELHHILQPRRHLYPTWHCNCRRPPRAAPTSEDESDLFGRTQGRRAPSAPRESVCLGHTHHFPFLGFLPAGHPCAILAPWADRPVLPFSQLSRLQQRLGIGAEIGSVALDWLSLLLCCFIYVAVWHESSGPLSRRATAPRIRVVLSAVGCRLAPLAPRKVRTVDERGEG